MIEVNGSCLYGKHQVKQQGWNVGPLSIPPPPVSGWESVSEGNYTQASSKVTQDMSWELGSLMYISRSHLSSVLCTCRNSIQLPCRRCWMQSV